MILPDINTDLLHPDYMYNFEEWEKYRYIMQGGDEFVDKYLIQYSQRETTTDFENRKKITPTAAFAKGALIDIKNAIFQRMSDIQRNGGSEDYQTVIKGLRGGVDRRGSSMNYFIGMKVLHELLFLGKIGVYVDMPKIDKTTIKDTKNKIPYFYTYRSEDILNWEMDFNNNTMEFTQLLLRDSYNRKNILGLPSDYTYRYRLLVKTSDGVLIRFYNREAFETQKLTHSSDDFKIIMKDEDNTDPTIADEVLSIEPDEEYLLPLKKIPFVLFELDQPLTKDIANHQITLMNLESSDASYILKANYPMYTEQRSMLPGSYLKDAENSEEGSEIEAGGNVGRAYGKDMERPGFIHPSPEPIQLSIEKQKSLKDDIRTLVNLSLSNVKSKFASAESKEMDDRGLESGLSALGLILEQGERELAEIFSSYEKDNSIATVVYPNRYSLKSDAQRLDEVSKLSEQRDKIPSKSCQKVISKKMASTLIGNDVSAEDLTSIFKEIEDADYISSDPESLHADLERGLVSVETAAIARGYDKSEPVKAKQDHAERIARIQAAQTHNAGARGIDDNDVQNDSAKLEKEGSQNPDLNDTGKQQVRGKE